MLNKIIRFSLNNRIAIIIAALAVVIGGSYLASRMEVDVFPDLNAPTVSIMTEAGGMAPEEVEQLVTYPIESALNGATGIRRVRSTSTTGFSTVWAEFDWDTDIYHARQIVAERISALDSKLPTSAGTPTMGPQSSILGEVMFVGLTSDSTSMRQLREIADKTFAPALLSTTGVAQVSVLGGDTKEYQIMLDPDKMRRFGVSLDEVLDATNEITQNSSGGVTYDYGSEYIIRGIGTQSSLEKIAVAAVKTSEQGPILLEDIAEVRIGDKSPITGVASISGTPGVLITITKQPDTGTIELTEKLDKTIADISEHLPSDIKVQTDLYRQQDFIDSSINNIKKALIEGAIFVALILFLFLMNPRTTLISLVTIPLALIMTIIMLRLLNLSINTMSIGGIAIAIGSLVDDAIVDVENVYKRLRENRLLPESERRKILDVVFEASKEVRMPILNSTLIIVVSFVPLFFLQGIEGRMLVPLGIAFITSLFASTLVALTLTPVLCSMLLPKSVVKSREPWIVRRLKCGYEVCLRKALVHKRIVIVSVIVLFIASIAACFFMGRSFLPPFNEGSFTINISSLPGISIEESNKIGAQAEKILMSVPEVKKVARKTGRAELDEHALGVNVSEIEVPYILENRSKEELMDDIRKRLKVIPGVNIEIGQPISHRIDAMLSGTQANIAIKIFGDNLTRLHNIGEEIKEGIEGVPGITDLNVEQQIERPQITISPRSEMLARYGITVPEFTRFVAVALGGKSVSQIYEGNMSYDVTVKVSDEYRSEIERIGLTPIDAADGSKIPLETVAEIKSTTGPNTINRENVSRKLVVSVNVADRDQRSVVNDIRKIISEKIDLPDGYTITYGGQFESEESASHILLLTSLFSILAIYMLLFNQFRNVRQSLVVMINLPLAIIGGILVLLLTSGIISIPAIIGFISLFGIATRNGMLLIDRYNYMQREEHLSPLAAVLKGSVDRLNPILMTAFTSALALVPIAAGGSLPGNEIQSPMAKVILGGLISSTLLNGFVIPVIYLLLGSNKDAIPALNNHNNP